VPGWRFFFCGNFLFAGRVFFFTIAVLSMCALTKKMNCRQRQSGRRSPTASDGLNCHGQTTDQV
jgi:hypothetical protein